jgi:hypothetical protein
LAGNVLAAHPGNALMAAAEAVPGTSKWPSATALTKSRIENDVRIM